MCLSLVQFIATDIFFSKTLKKYIGKGEQTCNSFQVVYHLLI